MIKFCKTQSKAKTSRKKYGAFKCIVWIIFPLMIILLSLVNPFLVFSMVNNSANVDSEDLPSQRVFVNVALCDKADDDLLENLEFFLQNGVTNPYPHPKSVLKQVDYGLVVNAGCNNVACREGSVMDKTNHTIPIRHMTCSTTGSDFDHHTAMLEELDKDKESYNAYIFLNSGVTGPFIPPSLSSRWHWTWTFVDRLIDNVGLVGTSIACTDERHGGPRVEGSVFAMTKESLQMVRKYGTTFRRTKRKETYAVRSQEWEQYTLSKTIFDNNLTIDSLQTMAYENVEWDPNMSCTNFTPSSKQGSHFDMFRKKSIDVEVSAYSNIPEITEKEQEEIVDKHLRLKLEFDEDLAMKVVAAGLGKHEMLRYRRLKVNIQTTAISIVISHCEDSVDWIPLYLGEKYEIKDIIIYSKCGQQVEGIDNLIKLAPTEVVRLDNIGRCDHSYAHWINENYFKIDREKDGDDIVLFLNDNNRLQKEYYTMDDMFALTSEVGFGCLYKPQCACCTLSEIDVIRPLMIHNKILLMGFAMDEYKREKRDKNGAFSSEEYQNLMSWSDAMGFRIPQTSFLPVCYGGMFAARKKQIFNQRAEVWNRMTNSLSRADNIIEGHYAERLWAPILSIQDERYLQEITRSLRNKIVRQETCFMAGVVYVNKTETFTNNQ